MTQLVLDRFGTPSDPAARKCYHALCDLFSDVATDLGVEDISDQAFSQYAADNQEDWSRGTDPGTAAAVFALVVGGEL